MLHVFGSVQTNTQFCCSAVKYSHICAGMVVYQINIAQFFNNG